MTNEGRDDSNAAPTALASTRMVILPEWMSGACVGHRRRGA